MNRHTLTVFLLWIVLTVVGELIALRLDLYPLAAAKQAAVVDEAFRFLLILAVPVFAFVVAILGYSVLQFRTRGQPTHDGPPVHIHGPLVAGWFVVTTALTILVIVNPGITGMHHLRAEAAEQVDLRVEVQGSRWFWKITYPEQGISTMNELVLPVDAHVRFDVTAADVLHAFWVPAFRMKIDAVPGRVTRIDATPNQIGSYADDSGFRLQCAELCGLAHAEMKVPVRVVSQNEFNAWVAAQKASKP